MCDITVETPFPGNIPLIPSFPDFSSDLSRPLTLGVLQAHFWSLFLSLFTFTVKMVTCSFMTPSMPSKC